MRIILQVLIPLLLIDGFLLYLIKKTNISKCILLIFLSTSIFAIIGILTVNFLIRAFDLPSILFSIIVTFCTLVYLPKLILLLFIFIQYLINIFIKVISIFIDKSLTKITFIIKLGILASILIFITLLYGITYGKTDYIIKTVNLKFNNLPTEFNNFKIVHISDLHIGNYIFKKEEVNKIVDLINQQNADIVVFTGDMVNFKSSEIDPYINDLKNIKSKYGKYSIIGNHDYSSYYKWENEVDKHNDFLQNINKQELAGFKVLKNSACYIKINNDSIELLGVENWGHKPFPQYADLEKTMANSKQKTFKILLSHDPNFWRDKVTNKTNIPLTLSGHTHGGVIGITLNGKFYSPSQIIFRENNGLYKHNDQYIYVNPGIGSNGFLGRVGVRPEITVIVLKK